MYKLITPPATDPVTLKSIKQNARIEDSFTENDDLLSTLQQSAVEIFQRKTSRQIVPATWELVLESFAYPIVIVRCPLISIESIKYYDLTNTEQTLPDSKYEVLRDDPASVFIDDAPAVYDRVDAVKIRFTAGYNDIPDDIKVGIMAYVTQRYEQPYNSVEQLPTFFGSLIKDYRIWPR